MNIDTRYPVRHNVPPGRERRACCGYLNQGRGLSPLPPGEDNDAQLFAQSRTLRIRQINGLDFSIEISTSPLQAVAILPPTDFHEVSRAVGPKGQISWCCIDRLSWHSLPDICFLTRASHVRLMCSFGVGPGQAALEHDKATLQ